MYQIKHKYLSKMRSFITLNEIRDNFYFTQMFN
jgi:hypothetical protein